MVAHILINQSTRQVYSFIIADLAQDIAEASKGPLVVPDAMVH